MHHRLELEVIELNFKLLQIVIESQDIDKQTMESESENGIVNVIAEHKYGSNSLQTRNHAIISLPNLWNLIQPSKSSAINYQIAKLLLAMAEINYLCVEKVMIASSIVHLTHGL